MPRIKVKRSSTVVDMTAMCDVSFLLLTFFILTAKFRPSQPVVIDIPSSRSETIVPENLMTISVDKEGKIYYSLSSPKMKFAAINKMVELYGDKYPSLKTLTDKQKSNFANIEMMGFTVEQLPQVLDMDSKQIEEIKDYPGIPVDSTNNQLKDWIMAGRYAGLQDGGDKEHPLRIAIKGDKQTNVKAVQDVIKTLTDETVNIHTFNLITSLEGASPTEAAPK